MHQFDLGKRIAKSLLSYYTPVLWQLQTPLISEAINRFDQLLSYFLVLRDNDASISRTCHFSDVFTVTFIRIVFFRNFQETDKGIITTNRSRIIRFFRFAIYPTTNIRTTIV